MTMRPRTTPARTTPGARNASAPAPARTPAQGEIRMNQVRTTTDSQLGATACLASREKPSMPPPAPPLAESLLPTSLTLYLTAAQRRAVLRALRRIHPDRTAALLAALDLA